MARVKIRLADNIARCVFLDSAATEGATLDSNLFLPSGDVASPATLREYLGLAADGTTTLHKNLGGLRAGDDHPQYTMWSSPETIKGQWTFLTAFWGADGAATAPEYTFADDTNTGLYRVGTDQLGLATGGVLRLSVGTTNITSTIPQLGAAGTALAPNWSFSGDPDSGLYSAGANQLGVAVNGANVWTVTASALTSSILFQGPSGSNTGPAYSFSADPNTGVYSVGADALGLSTGGVERLRIGASGQWGLSGANYGTSGQVLASAGNSAPPTWTDKANTTPTYLTVGSETATLPNSRVLTAGTNITFNTATPNVLTISASGGSATFSGASVTRSATQSIPDNTTTQISWDTETFDTDGYHEGVTHPTRLTAPATGYYVVGVSIDWASGGSAGNRIGWIVKNGSVALPANFTITGNALRYNLNTVVALTAGDYIEANVFQTSGGSLNVQIADSALAFWMYRVG